MLLVGRIEKSSKSIAWLQNEKYSLMAESSSPLTLFPMNTEIPKCSHTDLKMTFSFYNKISIVATTLKFVNNART